MLLKKKNIAVLFFLMLFLSLDATAQEKALFPVRNSKGKWGYKYETEGRWIVAPVYDDAGYFYDGMAAVSKTKGWHRSQTGGKLAERSFAGYIGSDGKLVVPLEYESTFDFCDGRGRVSVWIDDENMSARLSSRWLYGYVDVDGRSVVPCIYPYAEDFRNGMALVRWVSNGVWYQAYIDVNGEICSDIYEL